MRERESENALNRNLPPDLDDLVAGETEEVADMDRVAFHDREESLLPDRHAQAVIPGDHGLVTDIVSHIVKVRRTAQRFAGCEQLGNVRPFHEAEMRIRAPEIR